MRPIRLEVSGFTAFREPVVLDFDGCEFFALTGPTGAGKSSLIDAIVFALYGSIPRLDKNAVAPLVAQGMLEARVRLDFAIDGRPYTIVRVVSLDARTGSASRSEARLECDGQTLAGDAKSVSAEIARLIGLSFEQFTKCVVLPQGEFAKFLHDTPKERQTLLVTLLEMEQYRRMGERARERAAAAAERTRGLQVRLDEELSYATPQSRAEADAVLQGLKVLRDQVEAELPRIDELNALIAAADAEAAAARDRAARLRRVSVPAGVGDAGDAMRTAQQALQDATQEVERAEASVTEREAAVAALPARATLEQALSAHAECDEALRKVEKARTDVQLAIEEEERAAKALAEAQSVLAGAEAAWERARVEHAAGDLARTLVVGEACPVCRQQVLQAPELHIPADLTAAERAAAAAGKARDAAEAAWRAAERNRASVEALAAAAAARVESLRDALAEHSDRAALEVALVRVAEAEPAVGEARTLLSAAGRKRKDAQAAFEAAQRAEREVRKAFDAARDAVADLGPPAPGREDPAGDWEALAAWAATRAIEEDESVARAAGAQSAAKEERSTRARALDEAARAKGVVPASGERLRDAVVRAHVEQELTLERIDAALKQIEAVEAERRAADEEHQVAKTLGQHLSTKGFEKWLLDEAMQRLVQSASERMLTLSSGAYSLSVEAKSGAFSVVDHRNANESRSVKTLSGGETFLASLALALALAEDLGRMASQGVRLDSIFLDEGFGSLDPESLRVAVEAVEALTGEGRMVGLVTHLAEVAESVPVRFQVRRDPDTSRVERIER